MNVPMVERVSGSSPRMRGTRGIVASYGHTGGIIPAYAGNTRGAVNTAEVFWDHPRVCGEHLTGSTSATVRAGSSPRMRGTPTGVVSQTQTLGIIPAYAGNTSASSTTRSIPTDHPRVCGEHSVEQCQAGAHEGSSPRMRGTLGQSAGGGDVRGIIPAYAGNTLRDYSNFVVSKFMSFVFHLV